jgi:alkylation response protein AidB-like acyl-CoA dehydrogenase
MDERALVLDRIEQLLTEHPPATTTPARFWGAQFDLGLAWVHFPVGLGGLGAEPALQELVTMRLYDAAAPRNFLVNFVGLGMAAPVIVAFGTPEQQTRLLRPIFTCDELWCQLFSEPGAGSDLANVATTAARDGDEWIVNGHKVWTSMGHSARWGILIARSNPHVPKHKGLTYFICDMQAPGVDVRPLRQMSGEAEFNEVFLTDVRLPDAMRVGEPGEGWRVVIGTLMTERAHNGENVRRPRGLGPIAHALRVWSTATHGAVNRDRLMRVWIDAEVLRLTSLRAEQTNKSGLPGPEGSVLKLATGVLPQKVFELCVDLLGPRGMLIDDYAMRQPDMMGEANMGDGTTALDVTKALLSSRSATIGGGTTEIQKNTIAERVLGLPPEPRVDRDRPWSPEPRVDRDRPWSPEPRVDRDRPWSGEAN